MSRLSRDTGEGNNYQGGCSRITKSERKRFSFAHEPTFSGKAMQEKIGNRKIGLILENMNPNHRGGKGDCRSIAIITTRKRKAKSIKRAREADFPGIYLMIIGHKTFLLRNSAAANVSNLH